MKDFLGRGEQLRGQVRERLRVVIDGRPPIGAPRRASADDPPAQPEAMEPSTSPEGPQVELLVAPRSFDARHLVVVSLVLVSAVLGTWWWFGAAKATTIPVVAERGGSAQPSVASSVSASTASASASSKPGVFVHVLGAVKRPGVVELPAGARVKAALSAAGGLASDADPAQLNLAEPVADGCQIVIGTKENPKGEVRVPGAVASGSSGGGAASTVQGKINLNSADQVRLEQLPGVGPATAQAILAWRTQHGQFTRVEELQEVDGIGPKTFAKLAPLVEV